ncbi:MAG: insulinase family protein [Prevotellaceae bacterium]|jgi:predicted Zn-dependent peptidase|nr:insulinase family protein [Prevotellaceae bacterium]
MIVSFELPNRIRIIHKQTASPVVFCGLTVNTGTRDELENEHGIAHFLEHTLFKGTVKRKAYHINSRLESAGGELNAYTAKEETVIQACTVASDFEKAVELIADVTFNSIFPEHEINKEKQVICEEIDSYSDSPAEQIFDDFEDLLFNGFPIGRNILGTKKSVRKFTPEDLIRFVKRTYNTDQMVFSSAGNISENKLRYYCDKYFSAAPANLRTFKRTAPAEYSIFDRVMKKNAHQVHVVLGNRGYDGYNNRRTALSLLLNHLGGPAANSVLNMRLREKYGLVYNVETNYTVYSDAGNVNVYYATSESNVEKSRDCIFDEISTVKNKLLSEYQLAKIKKQYIGQFLIAQENSELLMQTMGKSILNYNRYDSNETIIEQIENVTANEIRDAANEIFSLANISTLKYM